ncbi:MAG TPA: sugar ABC transporter ATP-binding protein [Chloroflexota bacterium]|nr:sugar ABC transporter ATP-binding protein [Chloroflexota bacterium]
MEQQPLLEMAHIAKGFPGVQALDDVDFEVYPGEIIGFLGENGAGKSTLIKILSGVYVKDAGTIRFNGRDISPQSPQEAQSLGISTIHQELALIPYLSVAENIFLNREPRRLLGMVDFRRMNQEAEALLHDLGADIPGKKAVRELNVAGQQMVEIAKAVSQNARLILMDEPTSALSSKEADALFALMRRLQARGVAVVFVSHRLEEVRQIVDRVVIMRDGRRVGILPIAEASEEQIIRLMVGRNVGLFPKEKAEIGEPVLELRNVSGENGVANVNLTVRKGEIVGLAGLIGAGRTELARLICGVDKVTEGETLVAGQPVHIKSPKDAVRQGIGWVPEDRKQHGLVLGMNVQDNTTMTILQRISNLLGGIKDREAKRITAEYVQTLAIATPSLGQTVRHLSGGNQQKVVLAKWLSMGPKLLIMDEPTRGIDIGAKAEVHALMSRLAQQGMGILMISSEMPEIIGMSDRVIVMCQGRITGEFGDGRFDQEEIMTCATKFLSIEAERQLAEPLLTTENTGGDENG